jgi:hypothetical protein
MFSWKTSASAECLATPESVWSLWSTPETWPLWDDGIEYCRVNGPFVTGARGELKPAGGPRVRFRLLGAEPAIGFVDLTRILFTRLEFRHRIERLPGGRIRITHEAEMKGPLAPLLSRVLGKDLARGMPRTVASLARMAEARSAAVA